MKKLLSTTIILAMIATMMMAMCVSVSATDAVADYTIHYKGDGKFYSDQLCTQVITDLPEGLSADGDVITLENFHFATSAICALRFNCDVTIVVKGDNSISEAYPGIASKSSPSAISSIEDSITFIGDGSLKLINKNESGRGYVIHNGVIEGEPISVKIEGKPSLEFSSVGSIFNNGNFDLSAVTGMTAIASTDPAGSNPVAYNAADVGTYKYFKLYKPENKEDPTPKGVNTADSSNIALYIFMGMIAVAGISLSFRKNV